MGGTRRWPLALGRWPLDLGSFKVDQGQHGGTLRILPTTNDQWPTTFFHHREACNCRQTSLCSAVCYDHSFLQQLRGILVSPSRTTACRSRARISAPHLRPRSSQNCH